MNASFLKRLKAYLLDIIIVSLLFSVITVSHSNDKANKYLDEEKKVAEEYVDGKINNREYISKYASINYDIQKSSSYSNVIYIVLCVGYFMVFQYLNKGQTIGKKIMKIRVVNEDKKKVNFLQILIRTCIINEILFNIMAVLLIYLTNYKVFFIGYGIINLLFNAIIIASAVMIMKKKDHRGLHDILSKSCVIEEG